MGRAVIGLNAGLLLAFAVWAARPHLGASSRHRVLVPFVVGIGAQGLHFAEELLTGFPKEFPGLFGYAWSNGQFAAFNLLWLTAFAAAAWGLRAGSRIALLVVWFFGLVGGLGNGALHVGMGVSRGAYFPGLVTAPLLLAIGWILVRRLVLATRPPP